MIGSGDVLRSVPSTRRLWLLCLAAVWLAGGWYVLHLLDRTWIPHDDGSLAQAAERVLLGQMPHRDFADLYTGGLALLDALGFRVFGVKLISLRYILFGFFLAWVPAFYYCASRWVAPAGAAAATSLAIAWTIPNYPAAMPSWYNLFFTTFGAAALCRFTDTGRRGWLAAAGGLGGLSLLVKIAGLYYIAACLLFLVAYEALTRPESAGAARGRLYRVLVDAGLLGVLFAVLGLIRRHLSVEEVYHFFLPVAMLASLVDRVVARAPGSGSAQAVRRLWSLTWPFGAGLAVPVIAFLVPYAAHGDIGALLRGVFVNPTTRIVSAVLVPLPWSKLLPAGILAAAIALAVRAKRGSARWAITLLCGGLLAAGFELRGANYLYTRSWRAVSQAVPLVVAGGLAVFVLGRTGLDPREKARAVLLLALAGLCSLIEYPFTAAIYFCYAAPLALLALLSVLRLAGGTPRPLMVGLAGYYLAFAVIVSNHQSLNELGRTAAHSTGWAPIDLPRAGGVQAPRIDAQDYKAAIDTLVAHARGSYTYAGPDAPEIYFLSGLRNPTRALFDFVEPDDTQGDRVLALVDRYHITAIAINHRVRFSRPLDPGLEAALAQRFPAAHTIGRFTVRWRE